MRSTVRIMVAAGSLLLSAHPVRAALNATISDDGAFHSGFFYDALSLSFAPAARVVVNLDGGIANRAPTATDYAQSLGLGLSVEVEPRVSVSGEISRYRGEKGPVTDPVRMQTTGTVGDRRTIDTVNAGMKAKIFETSQRDESDRASVSVSAGWAGGKHVLPLAMVAPAAWADPNPVLGEFVVRDDAYSGGVSFGMPGTSVTASYTRHHYRGKLDTGDPRRALMAPLPDFGFALGSLRTSIAGVLEGLPDYESVVSMSDRLPEGFTAFASYGYTRMETDHSIARIYASGAGWMAARWIELRAGASWVRRHGETTRYITAGFSLFF